MSPSTFDDIVALWIYWRIQDVTVEEVVEILAEHGNIAVTVEKKFAKREVTLEVEHPLVGALQAVALLAKKGGLALKVDPTALGPARKHRISAR